MRPAEIWLSLEERRFLARVERNRLHRTVPPRTAVTYSAAVQLANGVPVCSQQCDDGWWKVVPTLSGELWVPSGAARPA
jgi:hypothetical protein